MRFSRLQMVLLTICAFALATSAFQYLLKQAVKTEGPVVPVNFEQGTVVESDLKESSQFPLRKVGDADLPVEPTPASPEDQRVDLVDINTATKAELATIKELSPSICEAIIQLREEGPKFASVEELLKINRMTPEKLEKIRSHLTLGETEVSPATAQAETQESPSSEQDSPDKADSVEETASAPRSATSMRKVNINTASARELRTLPGIGEKMAERIVEYRDSKGPFTRAEDLTKVKGIGSKSFEKLKDFIAIGE